MYIVEIASECGPMAKAGGLGEVIIGLSRALLKSHHRVEIIIPKYNFIDLKKFSKVKMEIPNFQCYEKENPISNTMWAASWEECSLHLLEARHPAGYFHREQIYGFDDDAARFLYFSKAALTYLQIKNEPIDILHIHDWHTAIVALLAKKMFHLKIGAIVLTIHNGEYQGKCATWDLDAIGLQGKDHLNELQDDDPENPETLNLLKGGVIYADQVVAVSPSYAEQITSPSSKNFLYRTFQKYQKKTTGILNGIDTQIWNPETDPAIVQKYQINQGIEAILQAKEANRIFLAKKLKLSLKHRPWMGAVTRIAYQKGPEFLEEALDTVVALQGVFILIGTSQTPTLLTHFEKLKQLYANSPQVFLCLHYEDPLAHLIYAALDFLIVPSLYEPCGLTQMIAMRYGTIPIVRSTGGLKDTVIDGQNGITFEKATKLETKRAVNKALFLFHQNRKSMEMMILEGMRQDFSWKLPSRLYLDLFERLTNEKSVSKNVVASG
jgi:starch synthase